MEENLINQSTHNRKKNTNNNTKQYKFVNIR